jgi:selenocysteine-specific elongation factor
MKSIIAGTAGHIDHGKTALVRALTGIDADRLPEEKRRGITIDIGFADLDLGDVRIGFVDVPGHERFVKNMLAGAHGIDVLVLVIAADEGVMPQTREHFDICRLLNVSEGIIVLSKKDLVDDDLLALVSAEAGELVAGSFLADAPILSVSSRSGEGIEELKNTLREVGSRVSNRSQDALTRLPIDRVFSMSGFGTVITGTLIAGEIHEGDELELLPGVLSHGAISSRAVVPIQSGKRVRVRGLQVHGAKVKQARAGQRTAVNLVGVEVAEIERGMVLAPAGRLRTTQIVDAEVRMLDDAARPLRSRHRVRVHLGAAEVLARVQVVEPVQEIKPGDHGLVQLRFETPMVAVLGDRFIMRSYSPQRTIGGGIILDPFASKHRSRDLAAIRERLAGLRAGSHEEIAARFTAAAAERGLSRSDLIACTAWREEIVEAAIGKACAADAVVDAGGELLSPSIFKDLKQRVQDEINAHHRSEPLSRGLAKELLRARVFKHSSAGIFRAVLAELEKESRLIVESDVVRRREHTRAVAGADAELRDRLETIYREAKLAPPGLAEAFARAGVTAATQPHARKILQVLIDAGNVVRVDGDMYFHRMALDELIAKLRAHAEKGTADRSIDVGAFKELAGVSRKHAIPLLEYLDRQNITRRAGDKRIIL